MNLVNKKMRVLGLVSALCLMPLVLTSCHSNSVEENESESSPSATQSADPSASSDTQSDTQVPFDSIPAEEYDALIHTTQDALIRCMTEKGTTPESRGRMDSRAWLSPTPDNFGLIASLQQAQEWGMGFNYSNMGKQLSESETGAQLENRESCTNEIDSKTPDSTNQVIDSFIQLETDMMYEYQDKMIEAVRPIITSIPPCLEDKGWKPSGAITQDQILTGSDTGYDVYFGVTVGEKILTDTTQDYIPTAEEIDFAVDLFSCQQELNVYQSYLDKAREIQQPILDAHEAQIIELRQSLKDELGKLQDALD